MGQKQKEKKKAPESKKPSLHTKDRKGGAKARKSAPVRRLNSTLDRFCQASNERSNILQMNEGAIKEAVKNGEISPMDGIDFQRAIHKCKVAPPDPKKIARLLCPNARF